MERTETWIRRLKSAPTRELTMPELRAALRTGYLSEQLFRAEIHRRKADDMASPWERAREAGRDRVA